MIRFFPCSMHTLMQRGGASQFNATMLFGDISYAGIDTSFDILNISSADELECVTVRSMGHVACVRAHPKKCSSDLGLLV